MAAPNMKHAAIRKEENSHATGMSAGTHVMKFDSARTVISASISSVSVTRMHDRREAPSRIRRAQPHGAVDAVETCAPQRAAGAAPLWEALSAIEWVRVPHPTSGIVPRRWHFLYFRD